MNVFLQSPDDRLRHWKDFRKSIAGKDEATQLQEVANFWGKAPLVTCAFDWTAPVKDWRTPWEMIHDGYFCRNGVALLMAHTLLLTGKWTTDRLKLYMIRDLVISDQCIMLVVDNQWLLNYSIGQVVDLSSITQHCEFLESIPINV